MKKVSTNAPSVKPEKHAVVDDGTAPGRNAEMFDNAHTSSTEKTLHLKQSNIVSRPAGSEPISDQFPDTHAVVDSRGSVLATAPSQDFAQKLLDRMAAAAMRAARAHVVGGGGYIDVPPLFVVPIKG